MSDNETLPDMGPEPTTAEAWRRFERAAGELATMTLAELEAELKRADRRLWRGIRKLERVCREAGILGPEVSDE